MARIIWKLTKGACSMIHTNRITFNYVRLFSNLRQNRIKANSENELLYSDYKISKENSAIRLQSLLRISKTSALEIIKNNKQLSRVLPQLITDNFEACKMYGITNKTILDFPELLGQKDLPEKIHLLNRITDNVNSMGSLLKVNMCGLLKIAQLFETEKDRILHLSKLLNTTPLEMCDHIRKKPFLLKLSPKRATESVQLLKDNGISDDEILSDLWVLNYTKTTVENRIQFVKENNFEKIKTWMIRAPSDIILNYIKIRSDNKLILGNNSLAEYLSQRLECSVEQVNYMITRLPALKGKSAKKIDEVIDFLYGLGIKPIQICITPKIFSHSVETTKNRVQELQQQGVYIDNLRLLTKSQKQYQVYYNKLVSANKKKLRSTK